MTSNTIRTTKHSFADVGACLDLREDDAQASLVRFLQDTYTPNGEHDIYLDIGLKPDTYEVPLPAGYAPKGSRKVSLRIDETIRVKSQNLKLSGVNLTGAITFSGSGVSVLDPLQFAPASASASAQPTKFLQAIQSWKQSVTQVLRNGIDAVRLRTVTFTAGGPAISIRASAVGEVEIEIGANGDVRLPPARVVDLGVMAFLRGLIAMSSAAAAQQSAAPEVQADLAKVILSMLSDDATNVIRIVGGAPVPSRLGVASASWLYRTPALQEPGRVSHTITVHPFNCASGAAIFRFDDSQRSTIALPGGTQISVTGDIELLNGIPRSDNLTLSALDLAGDLEVARSDAPNEVDTITVPVPPDMDHVLDARPPTNFKFTGSFDPSKQSPVIGTYQWSVNGILTGRSRKLSSIGIGDSFSGTAELLEYKLLFQSRTTPDNALEATASLGPVFLRGKVDQSSRDLVIDTFPQNNAPYLGRDLLAATLCLEQGHSSWPAIVSHSSAYHIPFSTAEGSAEARAAVAYDTSEYAVSITEASGFIAGAWASGRYALQNISEGGRLSLNLSSVSGELRPKYPLEIGHVITDFESPVPFSGPIGGGESALSIENVYLTRALAEDAVTPLALASESGGSASIRTRLSRSQPLVFLTPDGRIRVDDADVRLRLNGLMLSGSILDPQASGALALDYEARVSANLAAKMTYANGRWNIKKRDEVGKLIKPAQVERIVATGCPAQSLDDVRSVQFLAAVMQPGPATKDAIISDLLALRTQTSSGFVEVTAHSANADWSELFEVTTSIACGATLQFGVGYYSEPNIPDLFVFDRPSSETVRVRILNGRTNFATEVAAFTIPISASWDEARFFPANYEGRSWKSDVVAVAPRCSDYNKAHLHAWSASSNYTNQFYDAATAVDNVEQDCFGDTVQFMIEADSAVTDNEMRYPKLVVVQKRGQKATNLRLCARGKLSAGEWMPTLLEETDDRFDFVIMRKEDGSRRPVAIKKALTTSGRLELYPLDVGDSLNPTVEVIPPPPAPQPQAPAPVAPARPSLEISSEQREAAAYALRALDTAVMHLTQPPIRFVGHIYGHFLRTNFGSLGTPNGSAYHMVGDAARRAEAHTQLGGLLHAATGILLAHPDQALSGGGQNYPGAELHLSVALQRLRDYASDQGQVYDQRLMTVVEDNLFLCRRALPVQVVSDLQLIVQKLRELGIEPAPHSFGK